MDKDRTEIKALIENAGKYDLQEENCQGMNAYAFSAKHIPLNRNVFLKIFDASSEPSSERSDLFIDIKQKRNDSLFNRIVSILEEARSNVVRSVNSNMVVAYWLIGREIVQELQGGEERAEYGKRVLEDMSERLTKRYGSGYSLTNLKYFRTFYQVYQDRFPEIGRPSGDQSGLITKGHPSGGELVPVDIKPTTRFSSQLSWSHYRALMRVTDEKARLFYELEAIECGWSKAQLERQIHSSYYERIISNRGEAGLTAPDRERLPREPQVSRDNFKIPLCVRIPRVAGFSEPS